MVRVIARSQRVELDSVDFAGLIAQLKFTNSVLPSLDEAIEHYNQLIYSREAPSDAEVMALYEEFSQMIEGVLGAGEGKEKGVGL